MTRKLSIQFEVDFTFLKIMVESNIEGPVYIELYEIQGTNMLRVSSSKGTAASASSPSISTAASTG